MEYKEIVYERGGNIAVITFNRPEQMNSISMRLLDELLDILDVMERDSKLVAAVITGAGKAFMSGGDLKEMSSSTAEENQYYNNKIIAANNQIEQLDIPIIAAINGYAFGGGLELALACTMRFASERAKMALTEVKLGILPGSGGTQRLPRVIPKSKALRLLLTGETITAQEALEYGIVDKVLPAEELMDYCIDLASRIAENAPMSVRAIKNAVTKGIEMPMQEAMAYTDLNLRMLSFTADSKEGPRAFAEKRKPKFTGEYRKFSD